MSLAWKPKGKGSGGSGTPSGTVNSPTTPVLVPTTTPVPIPSTTSVPAPTGAPTGAIAKPKDTRVLSERFGNEKFGYTVSNPDSPSASKLTTAMSEFRSAASTERNAKVQSIVDRAEFKLPRGDKTKTRERSTAVMTEYPLALHHKGVVERLNNFDKFTASFSLERVSGSTTAFNILEKNPPSPAPSPSSSPAPSPAPAPEPVGQLLLGIQAFQKQPAPTQPASTQPAPRSTYRKHGRATDHPGYVSDDNDVPTRRYAYLETSRQQFMETQATPPTGSPAAAMRGRYVRHRLAMNLDNPSDIPAMIKKIDAEDPSLASLYERAPGAVPTDVMANIHQFLGSGINQRGISLTSTKKEFVYSNDGDPFRSADGVRLKVDLALVPTDVVLLNHYARGGVGSRLAEGSSAFPARLLDRGEEKRHGPRGYNYAASVVKNRELFLSELRAEWVVEVEDHLKKRQDPSAPLLVGPGKPGGSSTALAKDLGADAYLAGLAAGRTGGKKDDSAYQDDFAKTNYDIGYSAGIEEHAGAGRAAVEIENFWAGYDGTAAVDPTAPVTPAAVGAKARKFSPGAPRSAWFALVSLRSISVDEKKWASDMHDSFWLGWARAASTIAIPPVPTPVAPTGATPVASPVTGTPSTGTSPTGAPPTGAKRTGGRVRKGGGGRGRAGGGANGSGGP